MKNRLHTCCQLVRSLSLSALLALLSGGGFAQLDTAWQFTFGGFLDDHAEAIAPTLDSGYIVAGATSSFGRGKTDIYLFKLDDTCGLQWSQTIGGSNVDWATALIQTADRGYAIAGYTNTSGAGGFDAYLVKTDSNGAVEWEQTYGGPDWEFAHDLLATPDGGYLLCGETRSFGAGGTDMYLIKTDALGNEQWSRTYGGPGDDLARSLLLTVDSLFAVIGYDDSLGAGGRDMALLLLDQQGDTLWARHFGGTGDDEGFHLSQTADSNFLLIGRTASFGVTENDLYLIRTNDSGNVAWESVQPNLGIPGNEEGRHVSENPDGTLVICGTTTAFGGGGTDFSLSRLTALGVFLNGPTFGGTSDDEFYALTRGLNGDLVMAGTTASFGVGFRDAYVIRVEAVPTNIFNAPLVPVADSLPVLVGVPETTAQATSVRVYPQPASDVVTFAVTAPPGAGTLTLTVHDLMGRLVHESTENSAVFQWSVGQHAGLFLFSITQDGTPLHRGKVLVR